MRRAKERIDVRKLSIEQSGETRAMVDELETSGRSCWPLRFKSISKKEAGHRRGSNERNPS